MHGKESNYIQECRLALESGRTSYFGMAVEKNEAKAERGDKVGRGKSSRGIGVYSLKG